MSLKRPRGDFCITAQDEKVFRIHLPAPLPSIQFVPHIDCMHMTLI